MPPRPPEPKRDTRTPRGPEPLRRKRAQPLALPSSTAGRRKALNLLLAFATVVLLADALVGEKGLMDRLRARREYAQASAALDRIRAQNAGKRELIRRLREDPAAQEALAREELNYIRPGELLFIIRESKPAAREVKPAVR